MEAKGSYCWPSRRARGGSSCRRNFAAVCRWSLLPRRCSSQVTTWQRDQAPATAYHPSELGAATQLRPQRLRSSSAGANPSPACYCTPTPPQA
eukprot:scaffold10720_cov69-Phaeocystis_antarctica.AAC.13